MPPDALSSWQGWDLVDPPYLITQFVWWPADTFLRLCVLVWLLREVRPTQTWRSPAKALLAAINAEALLGLRAGILGLAGLIPGLALLAMVGVSTLGAWVAILVIGVLGLIPALAYYMRRSLAPTALLTLPLKGAEALDWSRDRLAGRFGAFLKLALPWWAFGLCLDASTLGLELLGDSVAWQALSWALGVLSLVASLLPLALFVAHDETA